MNKYTPAGLAMNAIAIVLFVGVIIKVSGVGYYSHEVPFILITLAVAGVLAWAAQKFGRLPYEPPTLVQPSERPETTYTGTDDA